ncbi:MAG: hypothetical protein NWE98_05745 [Candidatus Bathyarchaeota archaeon]|nr:hypothetical protein [Candidatus Bathyarchaeota archaeon]
MRDDYGSLDSGNFCYIEFENLSRDLTYNLEFGMYGHNNGDAPNLG